MKILVPTALLVPVFMALHASSACAQSAPARVIVPDTSVEHPEDIGVRSHTNHLILASPGWGSLPDGGNGPGGGMTPAQIRSFYNLPSTGGSNVIAIVDAFHYPTSLNDFNLFSHAFNLPQETSTDPLNAGNTVFQVVYAGGSQPKVNGGWAEEAAIDIEWAHAMAPNAKIVLVEADSSSNTDLFKAVDVASALPGVKEVSMSWSSGESMGETAFDIHFPRSNGIVYFAASGDVGGIPQYPSVCPNVVAAGGTSVNTNFLGNFSSETGWSGSGGGKSRYESRPSYQDGIASIVKTARGVPDISSDADPNTGVCVYDSTPYQGAAGWQVFGGTSVSSPSLAGMVNLAGNFYADSVAELTAIYSGLGSANFRDIVKGHAGRFHCKVGWDRVTGVGTPQGTGGM